MCSRTIRARRNFHNYNIRLKRNGEQGKENDNDIKMNGNITNEEKMERKIKRKMINYDEMRK